MFLLYDYVLLGDQHMDEQKLQFYPFRIKCTTQLIVKKKIKRKKTGLTTLSYP